MPDNLHLMQIRLSPIPLKRVDYLSLLVEPVFTLRQFSMVWPQYLISLKMFIIKSWEWVRHMVILFCINGYKRLIPRRGRKYIKMIDRGLPGPWKSICRQRNRSLGGREGHKKMGLVIRL